MGMPVITPSTTSRCQAITDIIESVALEQAALAHILNAEGEKLQRVIATETVGTEQLLETNDSVERMVSAVSSLEAALLAKLEVFDGCLCECSPDAESAARR